MCRHGFLHKGEEIGKISKIIAMCVFSQDTDKLRESNS